MTDKPTALAGLRTAAAKVDALASAAQRAFDDAIWPPGTDRQQVERIAHLVGATAEAAEDALKDVDAALAGSTPTEERKP